MHLARQITPFVREPEVLVQTKTIASMGDDGETVIRYYWVDSAINIPEALEAASIESLEVDNKRTIAIYQNAIFVFTATGGNATAAQAFDVELWEPPAQEIGHGPVELLTVLVDELLTMTDASLIE